MKIKTIRVRFTDFKLEKRQTPKLRGAIASRFPQFALLHHHLENDRLLYQYPLVQYKVIDGEPMIFGIDKGAELLENIVSDLGDIAIHGDPDSMRRSEISIRIDQENFGDSDDLESYSFVSPWMALNQKNHVRFEAADETEKARLLKSILKGNILSLSKTIGYRVENRIYATFDLRRTRANFKNRPMTVFYGTVQVNFHIPDLLGLGKSVSRGFGTLARLDAQGGTVWNAKK